MKWEHMIDMFYNLQVCSNMFNEYDHVILCVFLCHVRQRPPLEPTGLSATSNRDYLCICHSPSIKYVFVIYEMGWQRFLIDICMWHGVIKFANVYSMYLATWFNRGISTICWAYVAQSTSIYFSCKSRKPIRVHLEDKWER